MIVSGEIELEKHRHAGGPRHQLMQDAEPAPISATDEADTEEIARRFKLVPRQPSLDRPGGLNKGEFLAHRNVHRSEDETANPTIEGTS
jgi:hypothetical protein